MSSHSPSFSPNDRTRHKHKRKSISRSPIRRHHKDIMRDKRKKDTREHINRSSEREDHHHHHKRRYQEGSSDDEPPQRCVKQEPPDQGYERRENRDFREQQEEREHHNRRRRDDYKNKPTNPFKTKSEKYEYGKKGEEDKKPQTTEEKQKPNFALSGKLTEDTNTFRGVVIKYNEPPEARKPKRRWRLYPFKGEQSLPVLHLHRQSAYLLGRDRRVADIPTDHPSCSKQHAVLQFRIVEYTRDNGSVGRRVRPYIIDLGSGNGTFVNNQKIDEERYFELKEKDVVKFGFSSREYVLLHDATDTSVVEDDSP